MVRGAHLDAHIEVTLVPLEALHTLLDDRGSGRRGWHLCRHWVSTAERRAYPTLINSTHATKHSSTGDAIP